MSGDDGSPGPAAGAGLAARALLPAVLALRDAIGAASGGSDAEAASAPRVSSPEGPSFLRRLLSTVPLRVALLPLGGGSSSSCGLRTAATPPPPASIGLACLPGQDCSILSTLLHGHDSIYEWDHPLVRFFSMAEANVLRLVHPEMVVAVAAARFDGRGSSNECVAAGQPWRAYFPTETADDLYFSALRCIASWRACFPAAESVWFSLRKSAGAFDEWLVCARAGAFTGLRVLDLQGIRFNDDGARELSAALPLFKALAGLGLPWCIFSPVGALALAAALPCLAATLTRLNLRESRVFYAESAASVALALRSLAALEWLNVSRCGMGDEGLRALIATSFPGLAALRFLAVGDFFGVAAEKELAGALSRLTALKELLVGLFFDDAAFGALRDTLGVLGCTVATHF